MWRPGFEWKQEESTDSISKNIEVCMASSGKGEECSVTCVGAETGTVGEEAGKTGRASILEGLKATARN